MQSRNRFGDWKTKPAQIERYEIDLEEKDTQKKNLFAASVVKYINQKGSRTIEQIECMVDCKQKRNKNKNNFSQLKRP